MMGETVLYASGKLFGGVYDDRLLLKMTPSSESMLPSVRRDLPNEGAKAEMLSVDIEDQRLLTGIDDATLPELSRQREKSGNHLEINALWSQWN
ncbi:MAG: hypothetical protein PUG40_05320, partial [Berryella intestinalis]|nr:hypothetical protein [Berryella intestinalis]